MNLCPFCGSELPVDQDAIDEKIFKMAREARRRRRSPEYIERRLEIVKKASHVRWGKNEKT